MTTMNHQTHRTGVAIDNPDSVFALTDATISRRGILRAGGITIGLAALLAACVEEATDDKPARVGDAPAPDPLPEPVLTDGVLFRTQASLHYSIIDAHNVSKEFGKLSADQSTVVDAFIAAHEAEIGILQTLTEQAGASPWTCANPRFDRVVIATLQDRITGRPRRGNEEADVPPSDDPARDALAMAFAMESVGAATHQAHVPLFSKPEYRSASMRLGQAGSRRAAALALAINPANRVTQLLLANANIGEPDAAPVAETSTTVQNIAQSEEAGGSGNAPPEVVAAPQSYYAVPSQFGILSAFQLAIGAPSSGNQFTINIETPSINSFVYDYQEC